MKTFPMLRVRATNDTTTQNVGAELEKAVSGNSAQSDPRNPLLHVGSVNRQFEVPVPLPGETPVAWAERTKGSGVNLAVAARAWEKNGNIDAIMREPAWKAVLESVLHATSNKPTYVPSEDQTGGGAKLKPTEVPAEKTNPGAATVPPLTTNAEAMGDKRDR